MFKAVCPSRRHGRSAGRGDGTRIPLAVQPVTPRGRAPGRLPPPSTARATFPAARVQVRPGPARRCAPGPDCAPGRGSTARQGRPSSPSGRQPRGRMPAPRSPDRDRQPPLDSRSCGREVRRTGWTGRATAARPVRMGPGAGRAATGCPKVHRDGLPPHNARGAACHPRKAAMWRCAEGSGSAAKGSSTKASRSARNQVICRLASCRVASMACWRKVAASVRPSRCSQAWR